ncbi:hypothetical protein [Streptomyces triculaminicus]|uniref:hypothetical protein n=1 Tax=Streptomyces triculaminicus TaxID=2816232 RepID=UPI0037CFDEAB
MTPEAAQDALYAWREQLTAILAEPADGDDHGRRVACRHDQRRPVPILDLETGQPTGVH